MFAAQQQQFATQQFQVPLFTCNSSKQWQQVACQKLALQLPQLKPTQTCQNFLNIISYNVWFDKYYFVERFQAQMKLFQKWQAHVICLQEVTPNYVQLLAQDGYICDNFYMTVNPYNATDVQPYGVLILVNKHVAVIHDLYRWTFPTNQGRSLLVTEISVQLPNKMTLENVAFATVHLESMNSAAYRAAQMQISCNKLMVTEKRF